MADEGQRALERLLGRGVLAFLRVRVAEIFEGYEQAGIVLPERAFFDGERAFAKLFGVRILSSIQVDGRQFSEAFTYPGMVRSERFLADIERTFEETFRFVEPAFNAANDR
jgi:hypothetical protein